MNRSDVPPETPDGHFVKLSDNELLVVSHKVARLIASDRLEEAVLEIKAHPKEQCRLTEILEE